MRIIGITGPSGSGKSELCASLAKLGYVHADADEIYHELLESSEPLKAELVRAFGEEILREGKIDRKLLGAKVLGKRYRKRRLFLNKIAHKYVCRFYVSLILKMRAENEKGLLIDAPLLIESRLDRLCDLCVCVLCDEQTRTARIIKRDGITEQAAKLRIQSQNPPQFYASRADYIFINDGGIEKAENAAREIDLILSEETVH